MKQLIGVQHVNEENELENVLAMLDFPRTAGLELPEDYKEKESLGLVLFFFTKLTHCLHKRKVDVIPLENWSLSDRFYSLSYAKRILVGEHTREKLEREIQSLENFISPYNPPEILYPAMHRVQRCRDVLSILNSGVTLTDVISKWDDINVQREAYMLGKIMSCKPDVVIIGNMHAKKLHHRLPEYTYLSSPAL